MSSVGGTSPFPWSQHRKQFWRRADNIKNFHFESRTCPAIILDSLLMYGINMTFQLVLKIDYRVRDQTRLIPKHVFCFVQEKTEMLSQRDNEKYSQIFEKIRRKICEKKLSNLFSSHPPGDSRLWSCSDSLTVDFVTFAS